MSQQTVYIRDENMKLWKETKNKAELVNFALTLTPYEIETIKKVRQMQEGSIQLPAGEIKEAP